MWKEPEEQDSLEDILSEWHTLTSYDERYRERRQKGRQRREVRSDDVQWSPRVMLIPRVPCGFSARKFYIRGYAGTYQGNERWEGRCEMQPNCKLTATLGRLDDVQYQDRLMRHSKAARTLSFHWTTASTTVLGTRKPYDVRKPVLLGAKSQR